MPTKFRSDVGGSDPNSSMAPPRQLPAEIWESSTLILAWVEVKLKIDSCPMAKCILERIKMVRSAGFCVAYRKVTVGEVFFCSCMCRGKSRAAFYHIQPWKPKCFPKFLLGWMPNNYNWKMALGRYGLWKCRRSCGRAWKQHSFSAEKTAHLCSNLPLPYQPYTPWCMISSSWWTWVEISGRRVYDLRPTHSQQFQMAGLRNILCIFMPILTL